MDETLKSSLNPPALNQLPDVYYIILDEYGRSDVLNEILGYDNLEFIDYLKSKGFYVADKSTSNYPITLASIASSLNAEYLNDLVSTTPGDEKSNTSQMIQLIRESKARAVFEQAGYRFVSFASGYIFTRIADADLFYQPDHYINDFEIEFMSNSILSMGMDEIYGGRIRDFILKTTSQLADLPEIATDRPKFVFAHILAGHAPFVFGKNGEDVEPWGFSSTPGVLDPSGRTYTSAYSDQLTYINHLMETTLDAILKKSTRKPIIIIQGDHGPQSKLDWNSVENTCLEERMSILNAYYLPDFDLSQIYPSITPVNTFRLIFKNYLGMPEELLEDRSYFSLWNSSYQYIDVTNELDTCEIK